jgi:glycine/D-amino acid oxidase-like deaminating enzyme
MSNYDWIVIGNGLAGAALSYELAKQGASVLVIEQDADADNATRYSYGGIAYWSGTTPLMRQLSQEGLERHQVLSEELGWDTQFRQLDLLLTIGATSDVEQMALNYSGCANPPLLLDVGQACDLEPLLNPDAIAGALTVQHGHVHPLETVKAYNHAYKRLGGAFHVAKVTNIIQSNNRVTQIQTSEGDVQCDRVVVAAGGMSRSLLQQAGLSVPIYFTHAELIRTPPVDVNLQTLVMPAEMQRFQLEQEAGDLEQDQRWHEPDAEIVPAILDAGAIQFLDGSLCMGQISRTLSDPHADIDAAASEAKLRQAVGSVLPALESLPGTWHHCLVAFSGDGIPFVGTVPGFENFYLFSGFSSPFAVLPAIAQRFPQWVNGADDDLLDQMQPSRFQSLITSV